jgi:hypothetical protein
MTMWLYYVCVKGKRDERDLEGMAGTGSKEIRGSKNDKQLGQVRYYRRSEQHKNCCEYDGNG